MATQVQIRGGTTAEHAAFTGVARELTVDTTKKTVVVHDGTTVGGIPLVREGGGASVTTLAASSTVSGAGFTSRFSVPGPIGDVTPSTGAFTGLSASGSVTLGNASTDTLDVGNGGLIKDAAGNVGIDATPSAWGAYRAIDLGNAAAFATAGGTADIVQNAYHNGTNWIYKTTAPASLYRQQGGSSYWFLAPSGIEGDPIPFTNCLALGLGTALALQGATSVAGTGITFPATQDASSNPNTLDDYEEGTFTPAFAGSTSGTFDAFGTYQKIGNKVQIRIRGDVILAVGQLVGNVSISGLPFAAPALANSDMHQSNSLLHVRANTTTGVAGAPFAVFDTTSIQLHVSTNLGSSSVYRGQPATWPATRFTQDNGTATTLDWYFVYFTA